MSIETIDASIQSGSPIHLFEFLFESAYYRYTNDPATITALTYSWTPANIDMGDVEVTEDINKNGLELIFPRNDTFAQLFLTDQQNAVSTLTVYRGYENDNDFIAYWKGRVVSSSIQRQEITLQCESVFTSMRRPGVRGKFTKQCRHALYGRGCNVDANDSASDAIYLEDIVSDVSADGLTVTVDIASTKTDGWFTGGMIKSADDTYRFIRNHTGTALVISRPYNEIIDSNTVRLYPGCNRSMADCLAKFDNLDNFGGFPYTPETNPFGGGRLK